MKNKITVKTLQKYKEANEKFSALTAYDYSTAKYLDEAGIDVILIGDSLAMVALGYENTTSIGVEEMMIFTRAVAKGAKSSMVVTDMPFMSYTTDIPTALSNIGTMIKNGANAVKLEGCNEYILELVKRSTQMGAPVMAHIGFTPQSQNVIGGHYIQGKNINATLKLLEQAQQLEKAGAFAIVLEMVPEESAKYISEKLSIPTISCGAGRYCDAQVLVSDDLFGKFSDFKPKFARKYGDMKSLILDCAKQYNNDVKSGNFPNEDEVFKLTPEECALLYTH
ncbi:MAG: 3-methyl-2-oxobutanoate hydroxymethyltransferase [Cyanobacteria bacterium SIG26]|nr:3-methyl-2-oxobutanoate hydroxymethyltransferase [Cyanobacteria bacterium SIG26]